MLLIDTFMQQNLRSSTDSGGVFQLGFIWCLSARLSPLEGEFLFASSGQDIKPNLPF